MTNAAAWFVTGGRLSQDRGVGPHLDGVGLPCLPPASLINTQGHNGELSDNKGRYYQTKVSISRQCTHLSQ